MWLPVCQLADALSNSYDRTLAARIRVAFERMVVFVKQRLESMVLRHENCAENKSRTLKL